MFLINYQNENVGLYRDIRLAAINSSSRPILDKMRKNIIALFKSKGLQPLKQISLKQSF